MSSRPRLSIPLSGVDRMVEYLGWLMILALWLWVALAYRQLPEAIPIHFGLTGEPDAFGAKRALLVLPGVATLLFVGLKIAGGFPHFFNYPVKIDAGNALKHYTIATRLLRFMRLAVALIFFGIVILTTLTALHRLSGLGLWFMPAAFGAIFVPMLIYLLKAKAKV